MSTRWDKIEYEICQQPNNGYEIVVIIVDVVVNGTSLGAKRISGRCSGLDE